MAQYIPKSALVAELEREIADNKKEIERALHKNLEDYFEGYEDALVLLKEKFINTLEVKKVDLKQSYREYINNTYTEEFAQNILDNNIKGDLDTSDLFGIMSYGFELGLKAQKGE